MLQVETQHIKDLVGYLRVNLPTEAPRVPETSESACQNASGSFQDISEAVC